MNWVHTFKQRFNNYRDASQFIDRLYRAFDSETYGKKQDIGITKIEFKEVPEGHKIHQVQDLLHKETFRKSKAKIITALQ